MARDLVRRNVVEVAEVPAGRSGRPSKSLTPQQVDDVLTLTAPHRLHSYVVLSVLTGGRTEELRACVGSMCTWSRWVLRRTSRSGGQ